MVTEKDRTFHFRQQPFTPGPILAVMVDQELERRVDQSYQVEW